MATRTIDPELLGLLSPAEKRRLGELMLADRYDWNAQARRNQLPPPGKWRIWMIIAGRGWGKTRTGAEAIREFRRRGHSRIGLIARTAPDARDVMIEGESGLIEIAPPWDRPKYHPTKRRLTWPDGTMATSYTSEEPNLLRGPQHSLIWGDEPASWRYAQETYDMAMFGLRLGDDTRMILTGTPRPTPLIKSLVKDAVPYSDMREHMEADVVISKGNSYENEKNLAPDFIRDLKAKYEGTRLGRQEIDAELLEGNPHALFKQEWFDQNRLRPVTPIKRFGRNYLQLVNPSDSVRDVTMIVEFERVVVSIDPATTSGPRSNETGIQVMAKDAHGRSFLLEDLSGSFTPGRWARRAIDAYLRWGADEIVAEKNQGGEMVEHTVSSTADEMAVPRPPVYLVHSMKNKDSRADPISGFSEKGMIHHVGDYPRVEDQLVSFVAKEKDQTDDIFDAYVQGMTRLLIDYGGFFMVT